MIIVLYYTYLTNSAMLYCYEFDKYLSDEEFIRSALRLEVERNRLPDGYSITGVDSFLRDNPDCCYVERGNHQFARNSIIDRLLGGTHVIASIMVPPPNEKEHVLVIDYLMTGCGYPSERFEGFQPKIN